MRWSGSSRGGHAGRLAARDDREGACVRTVTVAFHPRHPGVTPALGLRPAPPLRLYVLMDDERILGGLNPEERRAAEAVRGPAVSSRRRLGQDDDDHPPDREPGRDRRVSPRAGPGGDLHRQGRRRDARRLNARRRAGACSDVPRRRTRAALVLREGPELKILSSKVLPLPRDRQLAPMPYKFTAAADLATEVEWTKNRR